MNNNVTIISRFLESTAPYDNLPLEERVELAQRVGYRRFEVGELVYKVDDLLSGVFVVMTGEVECLDRYGALVSLLTPGNTFGERGFLRDGHATATTRVTQTAQILQIPAADFRALLETSAACHRYFNRSNPVTTRSPDLVSQKVSDILRGSPVACNPDDTVKSAATLMRQHRISSLGVVQKATGKLIGILTLRDLANRVLAEGRSHDLPVQEIMTPDPVCLSPDDLGADILQRMFEHRIGHLPVVDDGCFMGMITQTDIMRFHAVSAASLVKQISLARSAEDMAHISQQIPSLLTQLVAAGHTHDVITRLITDVADTLTRRLLQLAEAELGPPPVPYLWAACGSQGRQEQTGVSDQDNCLFLDDSVTPDDMPWFNQLACFVSDGLHACGYIYCPGDMMATNPRWCQPVCVWRQYFHEWIVTHEPTSHMLASVMFDLRPIYGTASLFRDLQAETLEKASTHTIFMAHMVSNSLTHVPPLGLFRGFSTLRTGAHRGHIDLKHNGVVPVIDLARVYALRGCIPQVNTRQRLLAAEETGIISAAGARELIEAYDVIATLRLQHQATVIRQGRKPDNFLAPGDLSDFERNHLRNAFTVVRTMQSAVGQVAGMPR